MHPRLLALLVGSLLAVPIEGLFAASSSVNIAGAELEASLAADKSEIILGEPVWLQFKVRNLSPVPLQVILYPDSDSLGRSRSFTVKTVRSDGLEIRTPLAIITGFEGNGTFGPNPLPARGEHVFGLFLPDWAPIREPGTYTVTVQRRLQLQNPKPGQRFTQLPTTETSLTTSAVIRVLPPDRDALGRIIDGLGDAMVSDASGRAARALAAIDDPRAISQLRRAFQSRSYEAMFIAAAALSRFSEDEALEALKVGFGARTADLSNQSSVDNIRLSVAAALSQSPHPKAMEVLLEHRNDPSSGIRNSVLLAVARQPPAEALTILRELARDPESRIAEEAKSYATEMARPDFVNYASPPIPAQAITRSGNEVILRVDVSPEALAQLKDDRSIEKLGFARDRRNPVPLQLSEPDLVHLEGLVELRSLDLGPIPVTDAVLAHLVRMTRLESVRFGDEVTAVGLAHVAKLTGLTSLYLPPRRYPDAALGQLRTLTKLKQLTIGDLPVSDATLASFRVMTDLESLTIYRTAITDISLPIIAGFTNLEQLDLRETAVTDTGLGSLAPLRGLTRLTLDGGAITDRGVTTLAGLTALEWLQLDRTGVTDEGLRSLRGLVRLKTLYLRSTQLTDAGLASLSQMTALTSLDLSGNAITDAGLSHLAALVNLETLNLNDTKITLEGLRKLSALKKIRYLGVRNTGFPYDGSVLKQIFPLTQ